MKKHIKIIAITILSASTFIASAQNDRKHTGAPFISKDVVRFTNKNFLETPRLTVRSIGYPNQVISKDVHKQRHELKKTDTEGNVVSTGYPEWTISKAVTRIGARK